MNPTYAESTPETDKVCFDPNNTRWYVFSPSSRFREVADLLGLPFVPYCVGYNATTGRVFLQRRIIDPRTGKLIYYEVNEALAEQCLGIMDRPYDDSEQKLRQDEYQADMARARRGAF